MRLNEIVDPETHEKRMAQFKAGLQRAYAPGKQPSPEEVAAREQRHREYDERRQRVEQTVSEIAKKYRGDQYEQFEQDVHNTVPAVELSLIDLPWAFNAFNPEKKAEHEEAWHAYGRARQKSAEEGGSDPSIHGLGSGGARNYTGD